MHQGVSKEPQNWVWMENGRLRSRHREVSSRNRQLSVGMLLFWGSRMRAQRGLMTLLLSTTFKIAPSKDLQRVMEHHQVLTEWTIITTLFLFLFLRTFSLWV